MLEQRLERLHVDQDIKQDERLANAEQEQPTLVSQRKSALKPWSENTERFSVRQPNVLPIRAAITPMLKTVTA